MLSNIAAAKACPSCGDVKPPSELHGRSCKRCARSRWPSSKPSAKADALRRRGQAKRAYRTQAEIEARAAEKRVARSLTRALRALCKRLYPRINNPGSRAWYASASPAEIAEYRRQARENARAYYHRNPTKCRGKVKAYKRTHPEVVSAQHAIRQQRIECSDDGTLTPSALAHLFAVAHHCPYCSEPLTPFNAVLDHVIPLARGGQHSIRNAVVVCSDCNMAKGPKMPVEFIWQTIASCGSIEAGPYAMHERAH